MHLTYSECPINVLIGPNISYLDYSLGTSYLKLNYLEMPSTLYSPFVVLHLVQQPPDVVLHGVRNEPGLALDPQPDLRGQLGGNYEFGETEVGDELEAGVVHHDVYRASPIAAFEARLPDGKI